MQATNGHEKSNLATGDATGEYLTLNFMYIQIDTTWMDGCLALFPEGMKVERGLSLFSQANRFI